MSALCIYHGGCTDGLAAAAVVDRFIDDVEFHAGSYGDPPPLEQAAGKSVYVVDFSYKRGDMLALLSTAAHATVLDHHKTAEAELAGLEAANARIQFDMNRSGAGMAWDHFAPDLPRPRIIDHIEDRDLWRFALPGSKEINHVLQCLPKDVPAWSVIFDMDVEKTIVEGKAIDRYIVAKIADLKAKSFDAVVGNHTVPVANAPHFFASELAGEMARGKPFAACFSCNADEEFWSLRSEPNGLDVSKIAKQFGGGGHKHAAGFRVPAGSIFSK